MARLSKDDKIIKDNPGKSIHEYRLLGVSEARLKEMEKIEEVVAKKEAAQQQPQKVKPVVQENSSHRAQPQIKVHTPVTDMATLVDKSTGKRTSMTRIYAEKTRKEKPQAVHSRIRSKRSLRLYTTRFNRSQGITIWPNSTQTARKSPVLMFP